MELIRISDRKLKIMLTPSDMCHFDLNADCFGEDSEQMHRAFRRLMAEVRKQTDFEADDRQISVQFFPSREGGCEMFVSSIGLAALPDRCESAKERKPSEVRSLRKTGGTFCRECGFRFDRLDALLNVCKRLCNTASVCESRAYRDEEKRYYLILKVLSKSPFSTPEELSFIVEYGSVENTPMLKLYLREHALPICDIDAVGTLSALT